MRRRKALILNRASVVKNSGISRSVEERLLEPIKQIEFIDVTLLAETDPSALDVSRYDVVVMNRPHTTEAVQILKRARDAKKRAVVDLDDIPTLYVKGDTAYLGPAKSAAFMECLALADIIVCSTRSISDWVHLKFPTQRNLVIETGFDFDKFEAVASSAIEGCDRSITFTNTGTIKLGQFRGDWLRTLGSALVRQGWVLDIFADFLDEFPKDFPYRYHGSVNWLEHKSRLLRSRYPLAVVPLAAKEDDAHLTYARLKTPIKYVIYGGLGIPAIYSKSPIYEKSVIDRETGLLVENTAPAWDEALNEMMTNSALRNKIRSNALSHVRERYAIAHAVRQWSEILN